MLLTTILIFIGLSIFLVWYFLSHEHGEKGPIGALWIVAGFGLAGAIAAGSLEQLLPKQYISTSAQGASLGLLLTTLAIGAIEESCKFLPAALFLYKKRYFEEHTDGIIYFAVAGLGFGLPENILYTIQFGTHTGLARLILTPFFHSAVTSLVGYFLIKSKIDRKSLWTVGLALLSASILHGLYDFGAFSQNVVFLVVSFMITAGVTAFMFVLFMRAGELDRAAGLAVVGTNSFCRTCGYPNPKHKLYCAHCGNRA